MFSQIYRLEKKIMKKREKYVKLWWKILFLQRFVSQITNFFYRLKKVQNKLIVINMEKLCWYSR